MPVCKFHNTVRVKTFFLKINILRAISGDLFVIVTSIMAKNNILRLSEARGHIGAPSIRH